LRSDPETADFERARRIKAIHASPTYRLAEHDPAFMVSEAARASRLSLEFMRADAYLHQQHIESTVVIFGSARILAPEMAQAEVARLEGAPADSGRDRRLAQARRALAYSRYYTEARSLAAELTCHDAHKNCHEYVIATGGGPGIMEAANRGAADIGVPSIGFNIQLPHEQEPNPYITPTLAFRFHYFAIRKMHFLFASPRARGVSGRLRNARRAVRGSQSRAVGGHAAHPHRAGRRRPLAAPGRFRLPGRGGLHRRSRAGALLGGRYRRGSRGPHP
jgi:predicted Rossmann-fold nucleotide-binding protein